MLTKQQFLDSIQHETRVIQHLLSKLKPEQFEYCPGEKMRTTLELLRYLSVCAVTPAKAILQNDWSLARKIAEETQNLGAEDIHHALDKQFSDLQDILKNINDEELQTREAALPWGKKEALGAALVDTSLKFLSAYKLQLFLYAKMSGSSELATINCWVGMDQLPK